MTLSMPPMPLTTRLEGGRFHGKEIVTGTIPAVFVVPFSLGTPNPYPDMVWVDDDGEPVSPPTPAAYYGLRQRGDSEWFYEFTHETTEEHWTPETFAVEMEDRRSWREMGA